MPKNRTDGIVRRCAPAGRTSRARRAYCKALQELERLETRTLLSVTYELASIDSALDNHGNGYSSDFPAVSADGRFVAFVSNSTNLVANNTGSGSGAYTNIFVYDRQTQTTQLASFTYNGASAIGSSTHPSISADGRYVVFESQATNLLPGEALNSPQVFLADMQSQTITYVSHGVTGSPDGTSTEPMISADGSTVVFISNASNILANFSSHNVATVYAYNVGTHTLRNLTVPADTQNRISGFLSVDTPAISGDGHYAVFTADYLSYSGGGGGNDAYVYDLQTNTYADISGGLPAGSLHESLNPTITADGRTVAFIDFAINLSTAAIVYNLYTYDNVTKGLKRLAIAAGGAAPNAGVFTDHISGDGRFVIYQSGATNLLGGSTGSTDVYVYDTLLRTNADVGPGGTSQNPAINADGTVVAFATYSVFAAPDNGTGQDVYAAHIDVVPIVNHAPQINPQNINFTEHQAANTAVGTVVATDPDVGDTLTYSILDGNSGNAFTIDANTGTIKVATPGVIDYLTHPDFPLTILVQDQDGASDSAVVNIHLVKAPVASSGSIVRISVSTAGAQGNDQSYDLNRPSISDDGRYTVFVSDATNLIDGITTNPGEVYVYDRTNKSVELISVSDNGALGTDGGRAPAISGNGRYVAYYHANDIEIFDRQTRTKQLVPVDPEGPAISGYSDHPFLSDDGRYVTYEYNAIVSLIPAVTRTDIIVYDTQTGVSQVVSPGMNGAGQDGNSLVPSISADGRYVAFESTSDNLVPLDTNSSQGTGGVIAGRDIFVFDRQTSTMRRVNVAAAGDQADNYSSNPIISANGQFVAFESLADNLVSGANGSLNSSIYVYDLVHSTVERVSRPPGAAGDTSLNPDISADGRFVAFNSFTPGLVPGDKVDGGIYVYDRQGKTYVRADKSSSGAAGNNFAAFPAISGDGAYVSFYSDATNLVSGDSNAVIDAFLTPVNKGAAASPLPDLTGSFTSLKLGKVSLGADSTVIPGDKIAAAFALTNQGQGAASGSIQITFYASATSTLDKNTAIPIGTATHGSVAGGATVPVNATLTLPSNMQPGDFYIIADVDSGQKVTETDETNNDPPTTFTLSLAYMVGTFGSHNNASLTVADINGTLGTIKLTGGGSAQLFQTADGYDMNIFGATSKTTFTVTTKKGTGNGSFMFHTINVDVAVPGVVAAAAKVATPPPATLKSFTASTGILTGTLNVPAGITAITFDQTADDADIEIVGGTTASPAPAITIRLIHNLTVDSSAPIKSITTNEWTTDNGSTSSITAPSLGTLTVKGDKKNHLAGDFAADVILSNAAIKSTLGTVSIAGTVLGSTFMSTGNIGKFTAGAMVDSILAAGFSGTKADLPAGLPTALTTSAVIGAVTIKDLPGTGNGYDSSLIYAQTINTITLQDVLTVDAATPPGIAAHFIKSYTRKDASGKLVRKLTNLSTPTADADNAVPDDFVVKIV